MRESLRTSELRSAANSEAESTEVPKFIFQIFHEKERQPNRSAKAGNTE